jgi:heme/copper-type cytochrome/quinol oxidase subunit 2
LATQLGTILFFFIATAIAVAQVFILRSTARGMRHGSAHPSDAPALNRSASLEWSYAIVPALALVVLLVFSWRAMHPETMQVQGVVPGIPESSR